MVYGTFPEEIRRDIGLFSTALVLFTHGIWILSMHRAAGEELAHAHPKLYYDEIPYRGLYNIIAGFFLIGGIYCKFVFYPKSVEQFTSSLLTVITLSILMAPFLQAFIKQRKFMIKIKTDRKHRKILAKIRKDKWENEILSKSPLTRFLNKFVWTILIFSVFVGLSVAYYSIYTGSFEYFIPMLILFSLVYTTLHYRIATRGEKIQTFLAMFKEKHLSTSHIRRYTEYALIWYGICAGILLGAIFPIKSAGLERPLIIFEA